MSQVIKVGISDLNVARSPDALVTFALGSCVGICLYDRARKIAGLSHIMLPSSTMNRDPKQAYRFADTAIVILVQKMVAAGADKRRLTAKIAGGAKMFASVSDSSLSNIGMRNVMAVKETLLKLGIPIIAEDTGKDFGRTVYFYAEDGKMQVKSAKMGEWTL